MECNPGTGGRINSFALVSYIPDPLGSCLGRLRQELMPSCFARSHVTVLPPRSLAIGPDQAKHELTVALQDFAPFRLDLNGVEVFESTGVIYVAIGTGMNELKRMHLRLHQSSLASPESQVYHPHVTLAQDFPPEKLGDMGRLAKQRWAEFSSPHSFNVECLTFVQNTTTNQWLDLEEFPLGNLVQAAEGSRGSPG
jgi:2'-5' RNA ligase